MSNPYLGQIQTFGFNFAPRGWLLCNHQLLPISQNTALFSLFGTTYGGDGRTTFGIPGLRGRYPRGVGSGAGLDTVSWGEVGGDYEITQSISQMPSHNHAARADNSNLADSRDPNNTIWGSDSGADSTYSTRTDNVSLKSVAIQHTGGGQPMNILNPYVGIYYSVATTGIYPSRN